MSLAARSCAPGALASASVALPGDVDPLGLLAAYPRGPRLFFAQPEADLAVAAVGAAATLVAAGPRRFATLAALRAATPLPDEALWVGGHAFDDVAPAGGWRGFPAATLAAPRLAIVRRGGAARLVALAATPSAARALVVDAAAVLAAPASPAPAARRWTIAPVTAPDVWRRRVARLVADVAAGRVAKVVLARAVGVTADAPFAPLRVLARLRAAHPGCTTFGVGHGGAFFVGATPERLARVTRGRLETAAVAGTTARGGTRGSADALRSSPKERAEHAFVVDALRARLAPLVPDLTGPMEPAVIAAGDVHHLRTPLAGTLRPGRGLLDAVGALHPTPAVCGVPDAAARALLASRERLARGWYAGGVGWLDAAGDGEIVVPLRCALLRGRHATLFAGAGIVAGSDPDAELEETRLKLRPLLAALVET